MHSFGLDRMNTFTALGIFYVIENIDKITEDNFNLRFDSMSIILKSWQNRCLTTYSKVTMIKSLVAPKYTNLLLSLLSPNQSLVEKVDSLIYNFIWKSNPHSLDNQ